MKFSSVKFGLNAVEFIVENFFPDYFVFLWFEFASRMKLN